MNLTKIIGVFAIVCWVFCASTNAARTKTFVYCSEATPSTLDPSSGYDGAAATASAQTIFDRLVHFKHGTTEKVPGLAASWKISPDGKVYTFTLRQGVKWHSNEHFTPTRNLNADDVVFTFQRMDDKNHFFHAVGGGNYEYFNGMAMGELIEEVKKISEHQVQFVLSRPDAPFLANLAMDFASITSKEYAEVLTKKGKQNLFITDPIGTGPFILTKYVKDQVIRFKANPSYWQKRSPLDQLVFVITPDASVRYQKLKTGECHLIAYPSPADLKAMEKDPAIQVKQKPGLNVGYVSMNVTKKPFDDVRVRRAINLAFNRESYVQAIYLGNAVLAKNPMPPTVWGYAQGTRQYPHDPEKAKALLKEAGYPNGFETELWTLPVSRPYNPNGKKMGEMMQADLAKIGVKVKLRTYDWPTYLKKTNEGLHSLAQFGWSGDNGDPDNFLDTLLSCTAVESGSNRSRWCDPSYEKLVKAAKVNSSQKFRAQKYQEAQKIFQDQAPWATLVHSIVFSAMSKKVKGFEIDPMGHDIFFGVDLVD